MAYKRLLVSLRLCHVKLHVMARAGLMELALANDPVSATRGLKAVPRRSGVRTSSRARTVPRETNENQEWRHGASGHA